MNIGEVATRAGLPAKTIRYYEEVGLIRPRRDPNGYRAFSDADLHRLAFLGRARSLGFSIEDCRTLLSLYDDPQRAAADVRRLAAVHLEQIDARIAALEGMRATLSELVASCAGDQRPDCPILRDLARSDGARSDGPRSDGAPGDGTGGPQSPLPPAPRPR